MKTKPTIGALVLALAVILPCNLNAVGFTDTFDGPGVDPAWVTDRYSPSTVDVVGGRLELGISDADSAANRPPGFSSAFYNTQGLQRSATVSGMWEVSGDIEVTLDGLRRGDLWARTGLVGNETGAMYPIFGYKNFDSTDPFNPLAGDITSAWRVWDADTANGWVELSDPVAAGWHSLSICYDGSMLKYMLDGNLVYTDSTVVALAGELTTVFAQAYNFGAGDYIQRFDNIVAGEKSSSVPDAGSPAFMLAGAMGLLGFARRKLLS